MTNLTDMLSKFMDSITASTLVVERETKVTKDTVPSTNNGSTKDVQPPVVQVQSHVPNSEPVVTPVSAPMPNLKPTIPYPSRRNDERCREKANDQIEKFYEIFKDLSFEISLTDALSLMPKFASTLKALIENKEIKMDECLALADLGLDNLCIIRVEKLSLWSSLLLLGLLNFGTFNYLIDQWQSYSTYFDHNRFYLSSTTSLPSKDSDSYFEGSRCFPRSRRGPTSPEFDDSYYDPEGDILLLESFLNDDPSLPSTTQGIYLPEIQKELKLLIPPPLRVVRSFSVLWFLPTFIRIFQNFPIDKNLLERLLFFFSNECIQAFEMLKKKKLTEAPILIAPDWDLPFELMCDASDFAIGAVLGQRHKKHFRPIHYASKTMNEEESHYTTTEKEMLAVVYAFEKFRSYLILNKSTVYTDYSALKYLFAKKDSKARLLMWVSFLQEFTSSI
ncbi:reverse transcriptase domain-containing protein [Tanacetum coccineum]